MSDLSISDDELERLMAEMGDLGEELNTPTPPPSALVQSVPPPAAPAAERIMSQADIDALFASLSGG